MTAEKIKLDVSAETDKAAGNVDKMTESVVRAAAAVNQLSAALAAGFQPPNVQSQVKIMGQLQAAANRGIRSTARAKAYQTTIKADASAIATQVRAEASAHAIKVRGGAKNSTRFMARQIDLAHYDRKLIMRGQYDEERTERQISAAEENAYIRRELARELEDERTRGAGDRARVKRETVTTSANERIRVQEAGVSGRKSAHSHAADERLRVHAAQEAGRRTAEEARENLAKTKSGAQAKAYETRGEQERQTIAARAQAKRDLLAYKASISTHKIVTPRDLSEEVMRGSIMRAAGRVPGAARWVSSHWDAAKAFPAAQAGYKMTLAQHQAAVAAQQAYYTSPQMQAFYAARRAGLPAVAPSAPPMPGPAPGPPPPPNRFIAAAQGFASRFPNTTLLAGAAGVGLYAAGSSLYARYQQAQRFQGSALDLRRLAMSTGASTGQGAASALSGFYTQNRYGFGLAESASQTSAFFAAGGRGDPEVAMQGARALGLDASVTGRLKRAQRFGGGLGLNLGGLGTAGTGALTPLASGAAAMGLNGSDTRRYLEEMVDLLEELTQKGMKVDARSIMAGQTGATRMAGGDSIIGRAVSGGVQGRLANYVNGGRMSFGDIELARILLKKKPGDYDFNVADSNRLDDIALGKISPADQYEATQLYTKFLAGSAGKSAIGTKIARTRFQSELGLSLNSDQLMTMSNTATSAYAPPSPVDLKRLGATNIDPMVDDFEELNKRNVALADQMLPAFRAWEASLQLWTSTIGHFDSVVTRLGQFGQLANTPLSSTPNPAMQFGQTIAKGLQQIPGPFSGRGFGN